VIEGNVGTADFAIDIGLVCSLDYTTSSIVLLALLVRFEHPSTTRGTKWIMRLFRDETKPSKHRFGRFEQIRHTFLQATQASVVL